MELKPPSNAANELRRLPAAAQNRYGTTYLFRTATQATARSMPSETTESLRLRLARLIGQWTARFLRFKPAGRVWIDVGAHFGENTFLSAASDPSLTVYAFEPNFEVIARRIGILPNFVIVPMAVSEENGCGEFFVNSYAPCSSMLPLNPRGVEEYRRLGLIPESLDFRVIKKVAVPCTRLDTFLDSMGVGSVEFLKVDAQGADLGVVRSAGDRLADIYKITLEVSTAGVSLYNGQNSRMETIGFLGRQGFELIGIERIHAYEQNLTFRRKYAGH